MGWQNFVPLGVGVPFERRRQRGVPLKDVILQLLTHIVWKRLQIGTDMLFIITSTGDMPFSFINIDDLERPWTPKETCSMDLGGYRRPVLSHWSVASFMQFYLLVVHLILAFEYKKPNVTKVGAQST